MIWSSRERNRSCSLVSRRSRGRIANLPAPSARARRITACDSRESSKSICKEIALQRPKTGKFDYLSGPNHPARSIAFKFFTDDETSPSSLRDGFGIPASHGWCHLHLREQGSPMKNRKREICTSGSVTNKRTCEDLENLLKTSNRLGAAHP